MSHVSPAVRLGASLWVGLLVGIAQAQSPPANPSDGCPPPSAAKQSFGAGLLSALNNGASAFKQAANGLNGSTQQAASAANQVAGAAASSSSNCAGAARYAPSTTAAATRTTDAVAPAMVPAAPGGGIDPSRLPDLQGIHLGMSPEEILPKLKALYPGTGSNAFALGVATTNVQYISVPAKPWLGAVFAQGNPCAATGGACGDGFTVTFSAPPNKQVAVYLKRSISFASGKFPVADTIIAALKQKYGPNPVMLDATTLGWGFDESGQPLIRASQDKKSQPPCRNSQVLAPNHSIITYTASQGPLDPQELKHWILMKCGLAINVVAQLQQQGNGNGGLSVSGFDVTMTEDGEDIRDALAGEQYIENAHRAAQQQEQNNAQQQKAPAL